jgi:transposase
MATERLSMHKTREILRQKWALGRSHREVARSLGVSFGAVATVMSRTKLAGLERFEEIEQLGDPELEKRLYGTRPEPQAARERPLPDFGYLHAERRRPGVTLQLLHLEYLEQHPDGYRYSQFCERYRSWLRRQRVTMRQVHRGGEKMFTDYAGKKPHLVDPNSGVVRDVELFVAVLGASSYTFAEATLTQRSADFIASHTRALEYFGGVPSLLVPDQLKPAVTLPCRYEPGIQRTYEEFSRHYGTAILPARPARPRDKAKVEAAVLVVERWILARLRNETFFSLDALNERISELLEDLNDRSMRAYGKSRRELFERLDRPALKPLPVERFVYGEWKLAKVSIDYHVQIDHHYYSAPFGLVGEHVDVRSTAATVEIYFRGSRVASHARSYRRGGFTTVAEHMPKSHQKHLEWTPSRLIHWASTLGPKTAELVEAILTERRHPEQGYRSCLGILRLERVYGKERLEAACTRAVAVRARSYRHVDSILKNGLDRIPLPDASAPAEPQLPLHENIRGGTYYQ